METFKLDLLALDIRRINMTASINTLEDLSRIIESCYTKPSVFIYFYRNEKNYEIFQVIGKVAAFDRKADYNKFVTTGCIAVRTDHLLLGIHRKANGNVKSKTLDIHIDYDVLN